MRKKRKLRFSTAVLLVTTIFLTGCETNPQTLTEKLISSLDGKFSVNHTISDDSKWINSSIEDAIDDTLQVSVKDDFYTAVNKDWILQTTLDEDNASASALADNMDVVEERINALITECMVEEVHEGTNGVEMPAEQYAHTRELLGQFANMIADKEGRNATGVEPAKKYIEAIENIQNLEQMTSYLTNKDGDNFAILNLIPVSVEVPRSTRDRYVVYIGQDCSYSFINADSYQSILIKDIIIKESMIRDVEPILVQLGYSEKEAHKMLYRCFQMEAKLTENMETDDFGDETIEDYKNRDHFYTYSEIEEMQGNYPLTEILDTWGLGASESFNVENEAYIKSIGKLYKEENLSELKDYLIIQTLMKMLPYLDDASYDAYTNYMKIYIDDYQDIKEEDFVETFINLKMSDVLQEVYIGQYCDVKQKEELEEIIEEAIAFYRNMLADEEWLTEETRNLAIEKLDNICYRVLYPDNMIDFSSLVFEQDDTLVDMIAKINQFKNSLMKEKVNKKIDRDEWNIEEIPTTVVNAYYMPNDNSINILEGIVANKFAYDENAPYEQNLARVGTIIGHEITHAFDTSGYIFDKDGIPNKWWTYEDEEQFQIRASHLAKYFSALSPFYNGGAYNGDNVKGEAIADMGGVKCMLNIAKEKEDFDYDLFFTSYAQLWRSKKTLSVQILMISDAHPLDCFRTNVTLQQFDEFLETYDIQPGDGMYLAPEKRINVW